MASEEGRKEIYRLWTTYTYPCMVAHDYPVDPPPSEETFLPTPAGIGWHPYGRIGGTIYTDDPSAQPKY